MYGFENFERETVSTYRRKLLPFLHINKGEDDE